MCLPFKHKTFQDSSGYKSIIPSEKILFPIQQLSHT